MNRKRIPGKHLIELPEKKKSGKVHFSCRYYEEVIEVNEADAAWYRNNPDIWKELEEDEQHPNDS